MADEEKEKCFCHLNGYAVKDSTARKEVEEIKEHLGVLSNVTPITNEDIENLFV